jgi:hypothetical protein
MNDVVVLFAELDDQGEPTRYSDFPGSGLHGRWMTLSAGVELLRPLGKPLRFRDSSGREYDIDGALSAGLVADESSRRQYIQDLINQVAAHNAVWQHLIWQIALGAGEEISRYELAHDGDQIVLYRDEVEIGAVRGARWWAPLDRHRISELAAELSAKVPRNCSYP